MQHATISRRNGRLALAFLGLCTLSGHGRCAFAAAHAGAPRTQEQARPARLAAWPALDAESAKGLKMEIEKLRRASSPEMASSADQALRAAGAGVVPELLPALGKEKNPEALGRIEATLQALTGPEHTLLLAKEFQHKAVEVRTWVLERAAQLPDPELLGPAEQALTRARAANEKAKGDDRALRRELEAASLCATAAGSLAGFDVVEKLACEQWNSRRAILRTALTAVRGNQAAEKAKAGLDSKDRSRVVGALNVLSACGTKENTGWIAPFLDDSDNSIRVAAINACRGIVDGQGPVENMPVFEAVELAQKWKERIRR